MKNKIFLLIISVIFFASCEREIDKLNVEKGSADFSRYIAVGNSTMAGYADGALYKSAQENSVPNLIAKQLKLAGGGDLVQPMVNSEVGINFPGLRPKMVLGYKTACNGVTSLSPVPAEGQMENLQPVGYAVNNFAIPGAKSFHLLVPGYATMNPYYARFASGNDKRVIEDIVASNPSFFTLWLGDNDVLWYGLTGGMGDTITSPNFFGYAMGNVIGALATSGAQGVVANLPDITSIPYFATIPYNGLVLTQSQADSVNMAMALYSLPFHYNAGPNPFLIADPASPHPMFKVRQMQAGELVLLSVPQDSLKCKGMGIINPETFLPYPIPGQYVLTSDEVANIQQATTAYNTILANIAGNFNLGLADMNALMKKLQAGVIYNGVHLNAQFIQGGAFSLDGIHLNPRGNAIVANEFIDAINQKYGSTIPHVDVTQYQGVVFP